MQTAEKSGLDRKIASPLPGMESKKKCLKFFKKTEKRY